MSTSERALSDVTSNVLLYQIGEFVSFYFFFQKKVMDMIADVLA